MSSKFGSGYFGEWIQDEYGLPAYRYICNQVKDPKAKTEMNELWRSDTEHLHQVGNDRLVGVASNYGHIRVRQDEGSPKYLNDLDPANHQYAGGFGYLTDGKTVLSTFYSGEEESFDRIFGVGYYRKTVKGEELVADQTLFSPYGDDPILFSKVHIENQRGEPVDLNWIEYWGCQQYQFSFKAFARALSSKKHPNHFRRGLAKRFSYVIAAMDYNKGLVNNIQFKGHTLGDKVGWGFLKFMLRFVAKKLTGGPIKIPVKEAVFDDLSPPQVFLVSLDGPFDSYGTNAGRFFGDGGSLSPDGLHKPLTTEFETNDNQQVGMFLERKIHLEPGESKTLYFAYGYLPEGFTLESLLSKYETQYSDILEQSSEKWKKDRIEFDVDDEWVDRELTWHHYYLRSNLTFDSFFKEHILSQGHVYQYIIGFQGAARDPLQHAMPFIFTEPDIVKDVLRYTLKTVKPNGEIPYGIVGSGLYMPSPFRPSDQELWLLWLASEYVLANRDPDFLEDVIPTYPVYGPKAGKAKIRDILSSCYRHFSETTGVGRHGLQRLSNGDWNDAMVLGFAPDDQHELVEEIGVSVLNAAMATYVLDIYARMLRYIGNDSLAEEAENYANGQRKAVREQWTGKWFKRSWLTEEIGWVGEDNLWLEPQPWAIIGGSADVDQRRILANSIDENVRAPTRAGAMILGKPEEKMAGNPGTGTNAGVWPSINGTLVWALALVDKELAWDEWKKNSLAIRAESYPEVWYSIWSGPDTYNSDVADDPGQTIHEVTPEDESLFNDRETERENELTTGDALKVSWTDFPVMNMHPHAWPLQNIPKLLGVEFNEEGVGLSPSLPKDEYKFSSPLLEIKKSKQGYSGRYSPKTGGTWKVSVKLEDSESNRLSALVVNGSTVEISREKDRIIFHGDSSPDSPLTWSLRF